MGTARGFRAAGGHCCFGWNSTGPRHVRRDRFRGQSTADSEMDPNETEVIFQSHQSGNFELLNNTEGESLFKL